MIFESEKTFLLYVRSTDFKEQKLVIPLNNITFFINKKANKIILYFDNQIKGLPNDIYDMVLDITNDPYCDPKHCITNLGYFSLRFDGCQAKCHYINNKLIFEFPIDKFQAFFNIPLFLYLNDKNNFREKLNYKEEDLFLLRLEFSKANYKIKCLTFRDGIVNKFNVNLLDIENNYKEFKYEKSSIVELLKKYNLI